MVEDNEFNHELYKDAFTFVGFDVTILPNADGPFVDTVATLKPDIISMDIMMGKDGIGAVHDGFSALELLKDDPRTADIPVFMLTNFYEEGKVERAHELKAADFINLAGQKIQRIPEHFLRYIEDPKHYEPVHPMFKNI